MKILRKSEPQGAEMGAVCIFFAKSSGRAERPGFTIKALLPQV
jgi:hypothetical protein